MRIDLRGSGLSQLRRVDAHATDRSHGGAVLEGSGGAKDMGAEQLPPFTAGVVASELEQLFRRRFAPVDAGGRRRWGQLGMYAIVRSVDADPSQVVGFLRLQRRAEVFAGRAEALEGPTGRAVRQLQGRENEMFSGWPVEAAASSDLLGVFE